MVEKEADDSEFPGLLSLSRANEDRVVESAWCQVSMSPKSGGCPGTGVRGPWGACVYTQMCQPEFREFSCGSDYSFCGNGGKGGWALCP